MLTRTPIVCVLAATAVLGGALLGGSARADSCPAGAATFTGAAGSGTWSVAANWSSGTVPASGTIACIPAGAGTVEVAGAATAKLVVASSKVLIDSGGTLTLSDASTADTSTFADLDVEGTLLTDDSQIHIAGDAVDDGAIDLASGNNTAVTLESGTFSGDGSVQPQFLDVAGTVEPGGAGVIGTLHFHLLVSVAVGGTLDLDLASDSLFDTLSIPVSNGFVFGTIHVNLLGSYAPAVGTKWDFVSMSAGDDDGSATVSPSAFTAGTDPGMAWIQLSSPLVTASPTPTATPTLTPTPTATPTPTPTSTPNQGAGVASPGPIGQAGPPAASVATQAESPTAAARLALGCGSRRLALEDVVATGAHVLLEGAADPTLVGKKVTILFDGATRVATATVDARGLFSATAPLPPARLRLTNGARYVARLGALSSLDLKLTRRLVLDPPTRTGSRITLAGRVITPLTVPATPIAVEQQLTCGGAKTTIAHVTPRVDGTFKIAVAAPSGASAALYRLQTKVRESTHSHKGYATFSLPLAAATD